MSFLLSFSMYFLSFIPLWITVLFVDSKSLLEGGRYKYTEILSIIVILVISLIAMTCLLVEFKKTDNDNVEVYELDNVKECKTITSEFLLSYILPFFAFDFTCWDGVVEFLIFFAVFGFLCIRHNYFSVNIILEIMKYKMYDCVLVNDDNCKVCKTVISKKPLNILLGEKIDTRDMNNEFVLDLAKKGT